MSEHYKPIGGMFPGVRGSTKTGGTDESANKLVILNDEGLLDSSMFPDDIKEAGSVVEDLEEEVRNRIQGDEDLASAVEAEATSRRNGDVNLDAKISSVERSANAAISNLDSRLSETSQMALTAAGTANVANGKADELRADVGDKGQLWIDETIVEALNSVHGGVVSVNTYISMQLRDELDRIEGDVADLKSGSSGQSSQIDAIQSQLSIVNSNVSGLQASLAGIQQQLSRLSDAVEQQRNLVDSINTTVRTLNTKVSDLDRRVTALEEIVEPSNY